MRGQSGDSWQKLPGIRVGRLMKDLLRGADFDKLARAHDRDARRDPRHHRQAV